MMRMPFNFKKWIDENRSQFKPPVGNKLIWEDREIMAFVVGGPNSRKDYHINPTEEFFYQVEGDMNLRILEAGKPKDIPIREGEIFLLPAKVPHSPQRLANTIGLVIEYKRPADKLDGFAWFCEACNHRLYHEEFYLTNIVTQLPPIFERFFSSNENRTCKQCHAVLEKPA